MFVVPPFGWPDTSNCPPTSGNQLLVNRDPTLLTSQTEAVCGHRLHCLKPLLVTLPTAIVLPLCPSGASLQCVIPLLDVGRERLVFSVCVCVSVCGEYVCIGGETTIHPSMFVNVSVSMRETRRGLKAQVWFTTHVKHFGLVYNTVTVQWLLFMW